MFCAFTDSICSNATEQAGGGSNYMLNSIKGSSVFNPLNDISVATAEAEALAGNSPEHMNVIFSITHCRNSPEI